MISNPPAAIPPVVLAALAGPDGPALAGPGPIAEPRHDAHEPRHGLASGFHARETGGDPQAVHDSPGPGPEMACPLLGWRTCGWRTSRTPVG